MGGVGPIVDKAQEIPASHREPRACIGRGVLHHHSGGSSASALKCSLGVRGAFTAEVFSHPVTEVFMARQRLSATSEPPQCSLSHAQGWGGSPHHYPVVRPLGLGLCLTMATHCDHATNMSITSQHLSIVEGMSLDQGHASGPPKDTSGA
jgi:hypothetical protein